MLAKMIYYIFNSIYQEECTVSTLENDYIL